MNAVADDVRPIDQDRHDLGQEDEAVAAALASAFGIHDFDRVSTLSVAGGETLCDVGEPATTAWVVVSGRLEAIAVDDNDREHVVGVVGPGELVGEAALVAGGTRHARLRARRRTRLIELDREWLLDLLAHESAAAARVVSTVVGRRDDRTSRRSSVIAIVPLSSAIADDAADLARTAAKLSGHLLRAPGDADTTDPTQFDWLDAAEDEHGGVVLVGDADDPTWCAAISEAADEVYFIADAGDGPAVGELERHIDHTVARAANVARVLVLVHAATTDHPRHTSRWLRRRDVDGHLHVRRDDEAARDRVARHMIGRPLTLVVGAGGVRAAAAIGTARCLIARGVAIDAVAGTSGGAILAAMMAVGNELDEIVDSAIEAITMSQDVTIPIGSLIAGDRMWSRLQAETLGLDIEDCWLPLSVTSTDLTATAPAHHRRGSLADAVYASMSIPGVFPPVDIDGHLHVDGALFDSIPVEGARQLVPRGPLVVVDFAPPPGQLTEPLPRTMNGLSLLIRRLVPLIDSPDHPSPIETLLRATTIASERRRRDSLAEVDCHVHLDLTNFGVLENRKLPLIIELGELKSRRTIDDYLAGDDPPLRDPQLVRRLAAAEFGDEEPYVGKPTASFDDTLVKDLLELPVRIARTVAPTIIDNVVTPLRDAAAGASERLSS